MRMLELRGLLSSPGLFAQMYDVVPGVLYRSETGRIVVGLTSRALASERQAVEAIAHELNHIRGVLRFGRPSSEAAEHAAGRYYRP